MRKDAKQAGGWDSVRLSRWIEETRSLIEQLPEFAELPHEEIRALLLGVARGLDVLTRRAGVQELHAIRQMDAQSVEGREPRIRIYTLGGFAISIDGEPIGAMRKQPRKPLLLLKALVARGGHEVSTDTLASDLWPEADGATAVQSMNVTVHRLRKLLVVHDAIVARNGRLSLDPLHCWVDIHAFEDALKKLDTGESDSAWLENSVERFDAALDLYQGAFLPQDDTRWASAMRERLRSKFVRAVRAYAERCEKLGQRELAIPVYQRAIEIDPLAEELYRRLMTVYAALERYSDVITLYRRCRIMLHKMLEVAPAAETQRLYAEIRRKVQEINDARARMAVARGLPANGNVTVGGETLSTVFTPPSDGAIPKA
ncbi:MAG: BTAD domain-containing putative transcriptional regulator [Gammaproteobacteria bacterium]